jgi:predicted TIM-barrel fold metal-dependent hydrolase
MIVDSHVYVFEPADSPAGHASGREHLRWGQAAYAGHHQPAFRTRDRATSDSSVLAPGGSSDIDAMPDKGFRFDHLRGRFVWDHDGEEHTKQYFPPNVLGGEFTPYSMIAEMDYAGVDVALIHTDPMLVRGSDYLSECVKLFPDRFVSMAPVDEWRIRDEPDAVIAELTTAIKTHGLHAIKINPFTYMVSDEPWDDGFCRPFWEAATSLGVPIFFTLGSGPGYRERSLTDEEQRQGYLNELGILTRWMERYPDAVCSLTHGFPWRLFVDGDKIVLPEWIWEPFQSDNCNLEVCFPVRLGDRFDFPYREVWPTLEQMVERIGSDHLMWGTDMPFQNRFCTYSQSRQWIEKYCEFLSPNDRDMIMGGTAARVLGLGARG